MQPLVSLGLLGVLLGLVDCVATAATSPHPGSRAYFASLLIAPVLVSFAWSILLGLPVLGLVRRIRPKARAPVWSMRAVGALWLVGIVVDAARSGHGMAALALFAVGAAVVTCGLIEVSLAGGAWFSHLPVPPRRAFALVLGLLCFVLAIPLVTAARTTFGASDSACAARRPATREPPNVLLLSVDTLRRDAARGMRAYRRLARTGVEYLSHSTVAPWTLPSVASLLTGVPPDQHRAGISRDPAALAVTTPVASGQRSIADVFRAAGYRTHAVVTNPFLSPVYGIERGFCSFENVTVQSELVRALGHSTPLRLAHGLVPASLPTDRADAVRAVAERWIAGHDDAPFFLWVHFLDPHSPYGDRDDAPTSISLELTAFGDHAGVGTPFRDMARLRSGEYRPGERERRRIRDLYLEDVAFADAEIERLLDFLQARGLLDRTIVVLTSDHGEEFWEHGGAGHGASLYEEVLRVPLVIKPVPPSEPARVVEETSVTDVASLVLAAAHLPDAKEFRAAPSREGEAHPGRLGYLLFGQPWDGVRIGSLKYMRAPHGEERLYDLSEDPRELVNLVSSRPDDLARTRELLARMMPASQGRP